MMVEFEGVTPDPRSGLYEVDTWTGVPVRLHDMRFTAAELIVSPPTLVLRFEYDSPQWTPPEAIESPIAEFRFSGVQILSWEDTDNPAPVAFRGQVSHFTVDTLRGVFQLETLDSSIEFLAERLHLVMRARHL